MTTEELIDKANPSSVVGDCEFGAIDVLRQLDTWGWTYVLRQESKQLLDLTLHNNWQRFGDIVARTSSSATSLPTRASTGGLWPVALDDTRPPGTQADM